MLVKDINPGPAGGGPGRIAAVGDTLVFAASDGTHGYEPWTSDGTKAGTVLVRDLNPGPDASNPGAAIDIGGTVFMRADDGRHGYELWKLIPTA